MAVYFDIFSIFDHFGQIFSADRDQCLFHSVLAAVTGKAAGLSVIDLHIKSVQYTLQHLLRCHSLIQ